MHLVRLELQDWRNWERVELSPSPEGLTLIRGSNGVGKTNLLEAIAWAGSGRSFRGAPKEALVRDGSERAVVWVQASSPQRDLTVSAVVPAKGRAAVKVNGQQLRRLGELGESFAVAVFSPDDLSLVKAGPQQRRDLMDEAVAALDAKAASQVADLERILRQRNALLRQASHRWDADAERTLEVWDVRLAAVGSALRSARSNLVEEMSPVVCEHYKRLADGGASPAMSYASSWSGDLYEALVRSRTEDRARGVTTVGPHRDDLDLYLDGMAARSHASQGEQRCIALALRLAVRDLLWQRRGSPPVVVLDDVLSELDEQRASALGRLVSVGQVIMSSAAPIPKGLVPAATLTAAAGRLFVER